MANWFAHADPLQVTAWATAVLAFVGVASIVANSILAWQARSSAKASRESVKLQAAELDTVKRQLTLAEEQFAAARTGAWPRLRPSTLIAGNLYIEGTVVYVHGSEPASDIRIWIRGPSEHGAGWGLYTAQLGLMTASDREKRFIAAPAAANEQQACPFSEFFEETMPGSEYLVGLTWVRLDGTTDKLAEKRRRSLQEPPGITG